MNVKKAQKSLAWSFALLGLAAVTVWQMNEATARQHQEQLNNALLAALPNDNIAAVRDLLQRGADPDSCEQPASLREKIEADYRSVRLLEHLSWKAHYSFALETAVVDDDPDIVQALLAAGANVRQKDNDGQTALDVAQIDSDPKIYAMLSKAVAKQKNDDKSSRSH